MEAYIFEWFNILFRWFHITAGIAWIGASFYFIWLDLHLEEPSADKKRIGIKGELYAIHGGGFYEVVKYQLGPPVMPQTLHWFKWEAYTTWLTGMVLLSVIYYYGANIYLINPQIVALSKTQAILAGLSFIMSGFIVYELMLKSPLKHHALLFAFVLFIVLSALCYLACHLFSARGAFIHIGAVMGSIMAGNVFFGIIPAQKKLVAAVKEGIKPEAKYGELSKLRSTHNNYLTLPVLFIMVSNHYPLLYSHPHNWLILIALSLIGAGVRHFFNLRHQGRNHPVILIIAFIALCGLVMLIGPKVSKAKVLAASPVTDQNIMTIFKMRCQSCHSPSPTNPAYKQAIKGIVFNSLSDIKKHAQKIKEVVIDTHYMPLGNLTKMTAKEREQVGLWLKQREK